ncbi:hypothetical protein DFQ28_003401 [Apophysomyces sp. BC1034]|nr:hypothetical protein DFQ30_006585 [Apophysomyces sp. BC1015]KAG0176690.1 hypothetical protein DFQ29_005817 [Apophysomyces sp. BC1021]KAG0189444.1 hypothetical protein DFQ28_003401 [Apophysomyces sp. BC1034]
MATQALPLEKRGSGTAIHIKSAKEFCSYMPPRPGQDISQTENNAQPFCTNTNLAHGSKKFPGGFIKSAHFKKTSNYVQVTGRIDRSKYRLSSRDGGGQYDQKDLPHGTCNGWRYFVNLIEPDADVFCIRCCKESKDCNTGISSRGCERIVPGSYN